MAKVQPRLGPTLKAIREEAGLTISAVARSAGIDPAVLSRVESGARGLRFETVCRIAGALGASLDDIARVGGYLEGTASGKRAARNAVSIKRAEIISSVQRTLRAAIGKLDEAKNPKN